MKTQEELIKEMNDLVLGSETRKKKRHTNQIVNQVLLAVLSITIWELAAIAQAGTVVATGVCACAPC